MAIKLSKEQANAISRKIAKELEIIKINPIKEANESIHISEEYLTFENQNEDCIILRSLEEKYDLSHYDIDRMCRGIKREFFKSRFQEVPTIDYDQILDEVYLATIEASDIDTMITQITEKLK